jgi:hypothetical protein
LDIIADHAHFEGVDFDPLIIQPSAIANAKSPCVPRAGHGFTFHVTARQAGSLMGAKVIDCEELIAPLEDGDHSTTHGECLPLPIDKVADLSNRLEVAHGSITGKCGKKTGLGLGQDASSNRLPKRCMVESGQSATSAGRIERFRRFAAIAGLR